MVSVSALKDRPVKSIEASTGLYGWVNQITGADDEICNDLISNTTDLIMVGASKSGITIPGIGANAGNAAYDLFTLSLNNNSGNGVWFK